MTANLLLIYLVLLKILNTSSVDILVAENVVIKQTLKLLTRSMKKQCIYKDRSKRMTLKLGY